jgi:dTDP-D-glucose 4,6-dehydratase
MFLIDRFEKGDALIGDKFNIVGEKEMDNLSLAQFIAAVIGKELRYELVDFHSSRPGHDLRYSLDGAKLRAMGFEYPRTFEESLQKTIGWYLEHPAWLLDDFSKAQFAKEAHAFDEGVKTVLQKTVKKAIGQQGVMAE